MYLSGMSAQLITPRRKKPRFEVPRGAVGIGGEQTGIYPLESPGGWQIIGRCPLRLFDPYHKEPCRFKAGDRIRMAPIDLEEFQAIYKSEYND